jgi:general secretion pathway protein G
MKSSGFTLVEILIVVVILGILAAIVIPQFTDASTEAQLSSLCADLQTMRSQIELYKIQHIDNLPDTNSLAEFSDCMLGWTNKLGEVGTVRADYPFGPYMHKIPSNPFVAEADANEIDFTGTTCPADGQTGWWMNTTTGEFRANSLEADWPEHKNL